MKNSTPYYLFFDFDGTIFTDGKMEKATIDAIKKAQRHGCKIFTNTGRSLPSLFKDFKPNCDLIFDGYLCSASNIYLGNDGEICLQELTMPINDVVEVVDYIRDKSLWAVVETDLGNYTIEMHGHITYTKEERQAFADKAMDYINSSKKVFKFALFPPITTNYRIDSLHLDLPKYDWGFLTRGYEMIYKGYGKGKLLELFANKMNYDETKFIMFGDSENDLQAFESAKTKVAMKHSPECIKKLATYVAKTDLGVAEYLNMLFSDD